MKTLGLLFLPETPGFNWIIKNGGFWFCMFSQKAQKGWCKKKKKPAQN